VYFLVFFLFGRCETPLGRARESLNLDPPHKRRRRSRKDEKKILFAAKTEGKREGEKKTSAEGCFWWCEKNCHTYLSGESRRTSTRERQITREFTGIDREPYLRSRTVEFSLVPCDLGERERAGNTFLFVHFHTKTKEKIRER